MGKEIRDLINIQYRIIIDISTLARGVYVIKVFNNDFRRSIKVIKE
jgi:hypothetical protein